MNFVNKLRLYLENLDNRAFSLYTGLFLGGILLINALIIINFYYRLNKVDERIFVLNEDRAKSRKILSTFDRVKKHKDEVDKLLSEDPEFKIVSYFNGIRSQLNLGNDNLVLVNPLPTIDQGGKYNESSLKVQLTNLDMKKLCELLDYIDHDKRIYTKDLEIAKSKKNRKTLDVSLTIATLEPKTAERYS